MPTFNVTNDGSGAYVIDGQSNPTLSITEGQTYTFNINAAGHPFWIKTVSSTGTGNQYNDGVTNNGTDNGTITFVVPYNAPSILYYNCQFHIAMAGTISVTDVPEPTATPTPTATATPTSSPTPTPTASPTPTPTVTPTPTPLPPSTGSVPFSLGLTAETTIYQNEVKCRISENDFNYSQNPTVFKYKTAVTGSTAQPFYAPSGSQASWGVVVDGTLADNVTGSSFNPYATTIGLYNDSGQLLVVGKLGTPYPIPENTDMTFIVRWDS
jgi:hypothetical protein